MEDATTPATAPDSNDDLPLRRRRSPATIAVAVVVAVSIIASSASFVFTHIVMRPDPCRAAKATLVELIETYPDGTDLPATVGREVSAAGEQLRASCVVDDVVAFESSTVFPWLGVEADAPRATRP